LGPPESQPNPASRSVQPFFAALSPSKLPFPWGLDLHLIHDSLGSPEATTPRAYRLVQLNMHSLPQSVSTRHNGTSPLKIDPSHGLSGPHLIHGFLLLSKFSTKIARRSVKPFLQGSLLLATDRPHYSVCKTGHINVRSIVMWPNNNKCNITVGRSTPTHHGTAFHRVNIGSHSNPVNQL